MALQAEVQSEEHKEALALAIYHLHRESTGSVNGDIQLLSTLIKESVVLAYLLTHLDLIFP